MERLIKYSTLISSFLIFIGFLKLKFFYNKFDVNINEYIDLTEIIASFLNDLNVLIVVVVIFLLQSATVMFMMKKYIDKNRGKRTTYEAIMRYHDRITNSNKSLIGVLIFSIVVSVVSFYFYTYCSINFCIYFFAVFGLQTFILVLEFIKLNDLNEELNLTKILSIAIVTGILSYMMANRDYEFISKRDYSGMVIETNNEEIKLTKKDLYIGKTKNYIFLIRKGNVNIISNSIIKKITYKNLKSINW